MNRQNDSNENMNVGKCMKGSDGNPDDNNFEWETDLLRCDMRVVCASILSERWGYPSESFLNLLHLQLLLP